MASAMLSLFPSALMVSSSNMNYPQKRTKYMMIKAQLARSPSLSSPNTTTGTISLPFERTLTASPDDVADPNDPRYSIPIVDFSRLTSAPRDQKIHDQFRDACENWSCFKLINHGVDESLINSMVELGEDFFKLPEKEKKEMVPWGKSILDDPIFYGDCHSGIISDRVDWREYLKMRAYPEFHSISQIPRFSEISKEFSKRNREVAIPVIKAISETLGLKGYIDESTVSERGFQVLAVNYYPICERLDKKYCIQPHTDSGLISIIIQNQVDGLQVQHNGKWVDWQNSNNGIFVVFGDQMQIVSNNMYKSCVHRVMVNPKQSRISLVVLLGPSFEDMVVPSPELLRKEGQSPNYNGMLFKEFLRRRYDSNYEESYIKAATERRLLN